MPYCGSRTCVPAASTFKHEADRQLFVADNGNYVIDVDFGQSQAYPRTASSLEAD